MIRHGYICPVLPTCTTALLTMQYKPYIAARYPVTPKSFSGDLAFREVEKSLGQFLSHVRLLVKCLHSWHCTLYSLLSKGYLLFDNHLPLRSADELGTEIGESSMPCPVLNLVSCSNMD